MGLNLDQIYDAANNEEAFARLARTVARHSNADAAVLHWRTHDEPYFQDASLIDGASATPPCAGEPSSGGDDHTGMQGGGSYDAFVNWMASLGDASPHCISGMFDHDDMTLAIGLRRGADRAPFDQDALERLPEVGRPIMTVLAARDRVMVARSERALLETALDAQGPGVLMLSRSGRVRFANAAARRMVARGDGFVLRGQRLQPSLPEDAGRLAEMLSRLGVGGAPRVGSLSIHRRGLSPYLVSLSLAGGEDRTSIIAVMNDPDHIDRSLPPRLRALFGLGLAEAEIACALAHGDDLETIAHARSTSLGTVRNQLKSISAKMNCSRQSQVVAIVRSLPGINMVIEVMPKTLSPQRKSSELGPVFSELPLSPNRVSTMPLRVAG